MTLRTPYTQLYLHLVWATWDRHPFLADLDLRRCVFECLQAECVALKADVLAIGGVEDHVHVLVRPPATVAPATLVKRMKGGSSHLVNFEIRPPVFFKWQGGYGAFSVSKRHVPLIEHYVLRQEEHHREQRLSTRSSSLHPWIPEQTRPDRRLPAVQSAKADFGQWLLRIHSPVKGAMR